MAEVVQDKGHGLRFAEKQLKRHGWKHGKGLGREENGIAEAIKVKVKCDKGGVGHKEGEQFTFHWWDHVFNKASSSLQVESDRDGIVLKKTSEDGEEVGMISNKKPRQATLAKAKLYGCFVKSATLLSGQERPEVKSSKSSDGSSSSDEDDEQKLDLSSTTQLSDCELMKACGGRTAHKGARHGLTMSAKLARLEQQEAEFMAKYGKKTIEERPNHVVEEPQSKKKKKKSSKEKTEAINGQEASETPNVQLKKKKKKKEASTEKRTDCCAEDKKEEVSCVEHSDTQTQRKQKRKKKKNGEFKSAERSTGQEKEEERLQSQPAEEEQPLKKNKKSKKEKRCLDSNISEQTPPPKKKKSKEYRS
ncbi:G patch domain-containing protein 4 [Dunckerocampus dactyliophorus]|uniref:G patch domain-containing protein 4 n=1 Tax=Dunckerocampus dactyliophorus TaxID=161453 RepID=UPI002404F0AC|nr:G patch domain-containing protein 4 [Dunckerocampus dactyliophorus]